MEIVIDINDEIYKEILNGKDGWSNYVHGLIRIGTPLPKGHGRIIDESQVTGTFTWDNGFIECFAPTIIEKDKEQEE